MIDGKAAKSANEFAAGAPGQHDGDGDGDRNSDGATDNDNDAHSAGPLGGRQWPDNSTGRLTQIMCPKCIVRAASSRQECWQGGRARRRANSLGGAPRREATLTATAASDADGRLRPDEGDVGVPAGRTAAAAAADLSADDIRERRGERAKGDVNLFDAQREQASSNLATKRTKSSGELITVNTTDTTTTTTTSATDSNSKQTNYVQRQDELQRTGGLSHLSDMLACNSSPKSVAGESQSSPPVNLQRGAGQVRLGAAGCCCHSCSVSHWPARLKIVGPITTRRRCRRAEVRELKVIRSVRAAGRCAGGGGGGSGGGSGDDGVSVVRLADQRAPTDSPLSPTRSMSLSHQENFLSACPQVKVDGLAGDDKENKNTTAATSSTGEQADEELADEFDETTARTRFKANSISSCVRLIGATGQHYLSAGSAAAIPTGGSRGSLSGTPTTLVSQPAGRSYCLLCELSRNFATTTSKLTCSELENSNENNNNNNHNYNNNSNSTAKQTSGRIGKDYLKPGDWQNFCGAKPKRRHSWICR